MTLARHIATQRNQAGSPKAEFVRSEHGSNDDIAPGLEATIDAHFDALAQAIFDQRLLCFGQPTFPGDACVLDRLHGRGSGPAIVTADQDVVGVRFGYACGDGSYADAGNEFYADLRTRIDL